MNIKSLFVYLLISIHCIVKPEDLPCPSLDLQEQELSTKIKQLDTILWWQKLKLRSGNFCLLVLGTLYSYHTNNSTCSCNLQHTSENFREICEAWDMHHQRAMHPFQTEKSVLESQLNLIRANKEWAQLECKD
ncbi:MAG TPA: hypothetical protein VGW78_00170 [Candidatus Babeliales bacterium]|jgi:hypothetical protein|nr:hypothetical protein [Candidatus Babeliales bacterium]